jgi:pimeloyl-ACP methyl ester carboxylesterase
VREVAGPPEAPTLVLLHGLTASGGLNWFQTFDALAPHFRVIAPDLRGHGRGIRSWRRFRLADCADDVAELCRVLDTGPVIAAGYSMGGMVAQLLWHRHRERVAGLVLCATTHAMFPGERERFLATTALSALASGTLLGQLTALLPRSLARALVPPGTRERPRSFTRWAAAEMARHDWRLLSEASLAIARYDARRWIGDIDVPAVILLTERDRTLGVRPQRELARAIPHAVVHTLDDGHAACTRPAFAEPFLAACRAATQPTPRLRAQSWLEAMPAAE